MTTKTQRLKKKQKIRNNEYYNTQTVFDDLYSKAINNQNFYKLYDIITSEQNILLAYRNIKKNKGSKTSGTNKNSIIEIGDNEPEKLVNYVRQRMGNFIPHSVRRVEIEKENGKKRPLGIPTIEDRLIQQCIKQVLEPICEAKFHNHSYGFRPNRGTHHAIARALFLTNLKNYQYVVDIDIKGFFDNVNHAKLLKQMWSLGIRDKRLLCIISKMLKAEVKGIGIPDKGVPQGGILSPLLSNIVLNELDWWISSQWETNPIRKRYRTHQIKGSKGTLKKIYIVRYADDFKLFCNNRADAENIFIATQSWLKERLGLEISPEKSKIVNLKKNYSEFLGIKMKLWKKGQKYVIKSYLTDKSIKKCKDKLKERIKGIGKLASIENVQAYNATVLGLHNYYKVATNVNLDFHRITFDVKKSLKCRTKDRRNKNGIKNKAFIKFYGDYKGKITYIRGIALYPIVAVKTKPPMCFSQDICNYTNEGRKKIHNKLQTIDHRVLEYLMLNPVKGETIEYNDNRISLYIAQRGKCYISGNRLEIRSMHTHHKKPKYLGGTDEYSNLVFLTMDMHRLVHATDSSTITKLLKANLKTIIDFQRLNKLRILVGNNEISVNK